MLEEINHGKVKLKLTSLLELVLVLVLDDDDDEDDRAELNLRSKEALSQSSPPEQHCIMLEGNLIVRKEVLMSKGHCYRHLDRREELTPPQSSSQSS